MLINVLNQELHPKKENKIKKKQEMTVNGNVLIATQWYCIVEQNFNKLSNMAFTYIA